MMKLFVFTICNTECPYCYTEEQYHCSHISVQKQCNPDDCPFKDGIVRETTQHKENNHGQNAINK